MVIGSMVLTASTSCILGVPQRCISMNVGQSARGRLLKAYSTGLWWLSVPQGHCGTLDILNPNVTMKEFLAYRVLLFAPKLFSPG